MHIGLIGGIGPAATEYYYRALFEAHAAADQTMELTIVHADMYELIRNVTENNPEKQAEVFRHLIMRLEAAGAHAAAVTSMTGHFCINELEAISPLPLVNALHEVDAAIAKRNLKTVGLLGTSTVMGSELYGRIASAKIVLPQGDGFEQTHNHYMQMAKLGRCTSEQRNFFFSMGRHLIETQGAEAVLLGGTDLCLAFDGQDCGFEWIDCAQVHVDALFRKSLASP